jgi:hypothetical protein
VLLEQPTGLRGRQPVRLAHQAQQPIGGGWAERQHLPANVVGQL